jgi:hypothetical protein
MPVEQCICRKRKGSDLQCPNASKNGTPFCGVHRTGTCKVFNEDEGPPPEEDEEEDLENERDVRERERLKKKDQREREKKEKEKEKLKKKEQEKREKERKEKEKKEKEKKEKEKKEKEKEDKEETEDDYEDEKEEGDGLCGNKVRLDANIPFYKEVLDTENPNVGRIEREFHIPTSNVNVKHFVQDDMLCPLYGTKFPLYNIVCGYVRNSEPNHIVQLLQRKKQDTCTSFGQTFAANLIRVASENIFGNPEQSILELPANSIDAAREGPSIGRFGMGFFSVLVWLINCPTRTLYVHSMQERGRGFVLAIQETKNIGLEVQMTPTRPMCETGTTVFLDCAKDNLSPKVLDRMFEYLQNLRFVQGVRIYCQRDLGDTILINDESDEKLPPIYIELSPTGFRVEDWGKGIPTEALFGALLVPSLSTKTMKNSMAVVTGPNWDIEIRRRTNLCSGLIITVNRVVIYSGKKIKGDATTKQFILHLSSRTPLTIDRTDIITTKDTRKYLQEAISAFFVEVNRETHGPDIFYELETALEKYALASHNGDIVLKCLRQEQFKLQHLLVPYDEYDKVYRYMDQLPFRVSHSFNYVAVEAYIRRSLKNTIRKDPRCIRSYLMVPKLSSKTFRIFEGGLKHLLFVPDTQLSKKAIVDKILVSSHITKMSVSTESDLGNNQEIFTMIQKSVKLAKVNYLDDKEISDSIQHSTRRLEHDDSRVYNIVVMGKNDTIAQEIYQFLMYCSLYDLKKDAAGLQRRRRLVHAFNSLVDRLTGDYTYTGRLSYVSLMPMPLRSYMLSSISADILEFYSTMEQDTLDRDVSRYESAVENRPNHKHIFFYLNSSVFEPYISGRTYGVTEDPVILAELKEEYDVASDAHYAVVRAVNALPAMPELNRTVFITMFTKVLLEVRESLNTKTMVKTIEAMVERYADTFSINLTKYDLLESYYASGYDHVVSQRYTLRAATDHLKLVLSSDYSNYITETPNVPVRIRTDPTITSDQLLHHLLTSKDQNIVASMTQKTSRYEAPTGLQAVELVVNSGTNRNFEFSTLLELCQNAIDATRAQKLKGDIRIVINLTQDKQHVVFTVEDDVGIPVDKLVSLYIPFFSTKKQSDLQSTGEMGTGFFNVFRGSDAVVVKTRANKKAEGTTVTSRPLRREDQNHTIYDIEHTYKADSTLLKGTSVSVYIPSHGNALGKSIELNRLVEEVMQGVSSVNIFLNGRPLSGNKESSVSYLHTNGIPFQALSPFLRQRGYSSNVCNILSTGIFLNLEKEDYVVNQSRESLELTHEEEFKDRILKLLHAACVRLVLNLKTRSSATESLHLRYTHLGVDSGVDQVLNQTVPHFETQDVLFQEDYNLENFLKGYGTPNVFELQQRYHKRVLKEIKVDRNKEEIFSKTRTWNALLEDMMEEDPDVTLRLRLVDDWFDTKNYDEYTNKKKKPTEDQGKEKEKEKEKEKDDEDTPFDHPGSKIMSIFVQEYIKHARSYHNLLLPFSVETIVKCTLGSQTFFSLKDYSITAGLKVYVSGMDEFATKFIAWAHSKTYLGGFESYNRGTVFDWFLLPGRASAGPALPHEIEHLRRQTTPSFTVKTDDFHSNVNNLLLPGDQGVKVNRSFTVCTLSLYTELLVETNFLKDVSRRVSTLFPLN